MTADEFFSVLPESNYVRYQLVDGRLVVHEGVPSLPHQNAVANIVVELHNWTRAEPSRGFACLPSDFRMDDRNVFAPDVWWVAEGRRPAPDAEYPTELPDLVVEVRSPSTWRHDRGRKRQLYGEAGVSELWVVDPDDKTIVICRRSAVAAAAGVGYDVEVTLAGDYSITSPLLPGFSMPVAEVFRY